MFERKKGQTLVENYYYNFLSQFVTMLVPMITAPYLARVLMAEGNGQVAFANAMVTYFVYISEFGFSTYGQREIAKCGNDRGARSRIFLEIMCLKLVFSVLSMGCYLGMIASPVIKDLYKPLLLINSMQILGSLGDIRFYYTGTENFRFIARRTTIFRLLQLVFVFTLIHSADQVWLYLVCFSGSILIANIVLWPSLIQKIDWRQIKNIRPTGHLSSAFFVFLPVIATTIFNQIDATMIGFLAENANVENGCYNAAFNLVNMITVLLTLDTIVLASRNARDFKQENERDLKGHLHFAFSYVWELAFPAASVLLIASEHLSLVYNGPGYETTPTIMRIFIIQIFAHSLFSVLANQYFIQTGREKLCTAVNFGGIAVNTVLDLVMVGPLGGIGVAIASVISESVMVCGFLYTFIREKRFWDRGILTSMIRPAIAAAIAAVPMLIIEHTMPMTLIALLLLILAGAITYCLALFLMKDPFFLHYGRYLNPFRKKEE